MSSKNVPNFAVVDHNQFISCHSGKKNGLGKNEIVLVIIWIIMFTYTKRDDRT